jgi:hypothetical protein
LFFKLIERQRKMEFLVDDAKNIWLYAKT